MSSWERACSSVMFWTSSMWIITTAWRLVAARPISMSRSVRAEYGSGPSWARTDREMPEAATDSTRRSRSPMRCSLAAGRPAVSARVSRAEATRLMGSLPDGIRSCGVTQSPASKASLAIRRTNADFPEPASPRMVRPRSWMPAARRGRRASRQSLRCSMRPAHTRGTVSDPGLNGESRGVLMMISLSTSDWLDKFIKPGWVSGYCPRRADPG